MRSQKVTPAEFEALVSKLANPVITTDGASKFVVIGAREYSAPIDTRTAAQIAQDAAFATYGDVA